MQFSTPLILALMVWLVRAQTPAGFTPRVNTKLEVDFNATAVKTAGQELEKARTANQPQIALASTLVKANETFMFVMLDLDVPPANGSTTRRILLHAMITDFKDTQQKVNGTALLLASVQRGPAKYLSPGPPATDTIAHRYVQLLFLQPASLSVKASDFSDPSKRINFDLAAFETNHGLKSPIAANFFRVDGRASATATGTACASSGIPRSTTQPFEGAAKGVDISLGLMGLAGGLTLLVL